MNTMLSKGVRISLIVGAQILLGEVYGANELAPYPLSHYGVIMERAPFGPIPKKLTPEEAAAQAAAEAAAAEEQAAQTEEPPKGFEQIKVTALTTFGGKPAAGFTDGASNKSYYLREGDEFEGFHLVNVDFDGMEITLQRNALEAVLPLWINPATTNCADISSFGVTESAALNTTPASASKTVSPVNNNSVKSNEEQERERRRAEWRKKRDEERERRRQELEAMTPEEREQHLRQVNMDLIRSGDGPPLPIELTREEMEQLASEGFAVPGINAPMPEGEALPSNRPRGRRGRRAELGSDPNPNGVAPNPKDDK